MKFSLETNDRFTVHSYRPGEVSLHLEIKPAVENAPAQLQTRVIKQSFVLAPDQLIEAWPLTDMDNLQAGHMEVIMGLQPELVLLGSGERHCFPPLAELVPLQQARVGYEVMDSGAACRTYNVLRAEGRRVVAAIIVE